MAITGQAGGLRVSAAVGWAIAMALAWSAAIACISYGFGTLKLPVAVVAPLTNANALVAVAVAALVFDEWRSLDIPMIVGGTLLIVVGATLVSLANSGELALGEPPHIGQSDLQSPGASNDPHHHRL